MEESNLDFDEQLLRLYNQYKGYLFYNFIFTSKDTKKVQDLSYKNLIKEIKAVNDNVLMLLENGFSEQDVTMKPKTFLFDKNIFYDLRMEKIKDTNSLYCMFIRLCNYIKNYANLILKFVYNVTVTDKVPYVDESKLFYTMHINLDKPNEDEIINVFYKKIYNNFVYTDTYAGDYKISKSIDRFFYLDE